MRSIILVSTGVMDIGLKSERQPGVAVLGTGHIEACFHWRTWHCGSSYRLVENRARRICSHADCCTALRITDALSKAVW